MLSCIRFLYIIDFSILEIHTKRNIARLWVICLRVYIINLSSVTLFSDLQKARGKSGERSEKEEEGGRMKEQPAPED